MIRSPIVWLAITSLFDGLCASGQLSLLVRKNLQEEVMLTTRHADAPKVLVIEDEGDLRESIVSYLKMEGIDADGAGSLQAAELWMLMHHFDVLVLDVGLPDGDALTWLDRVLGAQVGADTYLVKPVLLEELTAVVRNLMRRLRPSAGGSWVLNSLTWLLVSPDGRSVKLSHSEHVLLTHLSRAPGKTVSRHDLTTALGHNPEHYDQRRLEIMVRRLRSKVIDALGSELPLVTAHRQGYAFTAPIAIRKGD
jgi:two-component system OmpR family response regulator